MINVAEVSQLIMMNLIKWIIDIVFGLKHHFQVFLGNYIINNSQQLVITPNFEQETQF